MFVSTCSCSNKMGGGKGIDMNQKDPERQLNAKHERKDKKGWIPQTQRERARDRNRYSRYIDR